jgi:hypothetical protein
MAMATCRECDSPVSTEARACPSCGVGRPTADVEAEGRAARRLKIGLGGLVFGVVALGLVASVLGDSDGSATRPGDPQVYEQIRQEADCLELFEGIDRNLADAQRRSDDDPLDAVVSAYATAYAERLAELQCPRR